jgi:hypothetical protein
VPEIIQVIYIKGGSFSMTRTLCIHRNHKVRKAMEKGNKYQSLFFLEKKHLALCYSNISSLLNQYYYEEIGSGYTQQRKVPL